MSVDQFIYTTFQIYLIRQCNQMCYNEDICSRTNCREINASKAANITKTFNSTVKACDNFYEHACGKSQDANEYNWLSNQSVINLQMSFVLNEFTIGENKPKFINEVRKYYESCKNLKEEGYEAHHYLHWLLLHDQFEWPYIMPTYTKLDWVKTFAKMCTYGLNDVFIQLDFVSKANDVNDLLITLAMPSIDGGFEPLTATDFNTIMAMISPLDCFEKEWPGIRDFEKRLTQLKYKEDLEGKRLTKLKDLPLQWLQQYLQIVLNQTTISPGMELFIQDKSYMLALDELLSNCNQYFLNKYLMIRFLRYLISIPPNDFNATDCVHSTRSLMATAMHWLYEQQHPDLRKEFANISEIFNRLRHQFRKTIQANKYGFNATIVQHLQSKLDHMKLRLNNIPRVDTVSTLERFYHGLDLNADDFYGNHLKLLKFCFNADLVLLDKKKTVLDFTYLADTNTYVSSSPYFMHKANTIVVPLTLLQLPYYQANFTSIFKYSSVGFFLAHEMFHAFDDTGLLMNANGTESIINFKENTLYNANFNCLLKINRASINEKIADVSALHYAYHMFVDGEFERRKEEYKKVFFLNFAQSFCGRTTSLSHGSDSDRVMDALAQLPEFAKVYKCSKNDTLYPHQRCNLWH